MTDIQDLLSDNSCATKENHAAQVLGDSMEPEFPDKCVVIIHPSDRAYSGAYVFAEVEGARWFRQYFRDEQGERLVADNPRYPVMPLADLEWRILGVVVQRNVGRKIKHYHPAADDHGQAITPH